VRPNNSLERTRKQPRAAQLDGVSQQGEQRVLCHRKPSGDLPEEVKSTHAQSVRVVDGLAKNTLASWLAGSGRKVAIEKRKASGTVEIGARVSRYLIECSDKSGDKITE